MAVRIGALTINDTDRVFATTPGQRVIWDAVQDELRKHNAELNAIMRMFIEETTSDYKLRYKLPGGGRMQMRGGQARSAEVKGVGEWDIGLPLYEWGDAIGGDAVTLGYMTAAEMRRHLDTVYERHINTVRYELLYTLLNNTAKSFDDPVHGAFNVEPLANGDAVVYPPVLGSESEAVEDHYLESGYLYTAISDTNNPLITMRDELEEHFGSPGGGSNIVCMFPAVVVRKMEAVLSDWTPVTDRFVRPGSDADILQSIPTIPGKIVARCNGVWVGEWRWLPVAAVPYGLGIHLDANAPIKRRVDPADTGLPRGLALVSRDEVYPFTDTQWRLREGYGIGNRLNGVVMEFGTGGTYTVPTGY